MNWPQILCDKNSFQQLSSKNSKNGIYISNSFIVIVIKIQLNGLQSWIIFFLYQFKILCAKICLCRLNFHLPNAYKGWMNMCEVGGEKSKIETYQFQKKEINPIFLFFSLFLLLHFRLFWCWNHSNCTEIHILPL